MIIGVLYDFGGEAAGLQIRRLAYIGSGLQMSGIEISYLFPS